jgi:hypothetical protein
MKPLSERFRRVRLGTKFTAALLVVLIVAVTMSTIALWRVLQVDAESNVTSRGEVLLQMINSVRSYTSSHVRPTLREALADEDAFVPEQVPAFSARETFVTFREDPAYEDFMFKEASINPSNPDNLADEFERDLLRQFNADPELDELSGFRTRDGVNWYYIARPLTISDEACLACHGNPSDAPADLLLTYGDTNGFGWQVGDVAAAQTLYVPAQKVMDDALQSLIMLLVVFIGASVGIILLINFWLNPLVIRPVTEVAKVAELIAEGSLDAPACVDQDLGDIARRGDEVGQLARVFQTMCQEVYAREARLREQVQQLRIEIDKAKRDRQVSAITDSEYFQDLQAKAKDLRRKRGAHTGGKLGDGPAGA